MRQFIQGAAQGTAFSQRGPEPRNTASAGARSVRHKELVFSPGTQNSMSARMVDSRCHFEEGARPIKKDAWRNLI